MLNVLIVRLGKKRLRWAAVAVVAVALGTGGLTPASALAPLPSGEYVVSAASTADRQALIEDLHIDVTRRLDVVQGFAAKLTSDQVTKLSGDSRVRGVSVSVAVAGSAQRVTPTIGAVEADKDPVKAGSGGAAWDGPHVAVIDSGVSTHPDINLVQQVNCFGSGTANDANGHGTGVSGYMAAIDDGKGIVGIAPGAPVHSVRVLDAKNKGTLETVMCGLNWVAANAQSNNIKVVNMSLAFKGADDGNCGFSNGDVMHQAICSLFEQGITVVASAGNTTEDLGKWLPASYGEVLAATNIADFDGKPGALSAAPCSVSTTDDTPSLSSNFAVSVADQVHTLGAPGTCPYTTQVGNRYGYIQSGTSMAAAALSGAVLDCLRPSGACVGKNAVEVQATMMHQAAAAAVRGHRFAGDPLSPVAGRYYGYLASTVPAVLVPPVTTPTPEPPTPTPTPTPTPEPPTPTPTPAPDKTAPTVSITSPASGSTVSGVVFATALATDNVGVVKVTFYSGTKVLGQGVLGADSLWTGSFDSRGFRNGSYPITVKAVDAAGNSTTSTAITVRVLN
ncbi:hypothetical protein BH09ACT10_BH09ACT10_23990 [soil metagenome]